MLLSALPLQGFALFDWFKVKVTDVEILSGAPVSYQYVQNNEGIFEPELVYLYGYEGVGPLEYEVKLSNGKSCVIDSRDGSENNWLSGIEYIYAYSVVNKEECAEAIAEGKSTVDVHISVVVWYNSDEFNTFIFTKEYPIVEKIVDDIRLVDSMPESFNEDWPYDDFVGKKFEVDYADGRTETYTLTTDMNAGYYLGDYYVVLWYGEDQYVDENTDEIVYYKGLDVMYMDAVSPIERKLLPCPYDSIEITDYELDGKGGVTEVTYKLVYTDGKVLEKTYTPDAPMTTAEYYVIDNVDGNDVNFGVSNWSDTYSMEVWIGYRIWEKYYIAEYDGITDFCDCRCHKDGLLNVIINTILYKICQILRINEYCQCGAWHW